MSIETHELSAAAQAAVLEKSHAFHPELGHQFVLLTAGARHEKAFLKAARHLCYSFLQYDKAALRDIIFEDVPALADFHAAVRDILHAVRQLEKGTTAAQ